MEKNIAGVKKSGKFNVLQHRQIVYFIILNSTETIFNTQFRPMSEKYIKDEYKYNR